MAARFFVAVAPALKMFRQGELRRFAAERSGALLVLNKNDREGAKGAKKAAKEETERSFLLRGLLRVLRAFAVALIG